MTHLISAEFYKLVRSRAFWVLLIVVTLLAALTGVMFNFVPVRILESAFGGLKLEAGQTPFALYLHMMDPMAICIGVFVGIQISGELDNGSVRNPLSVGRKRIDYFVGKMTMNAVTCVSFVLISIVMVTALTCFRLDWGTPVTLLYFTNVIGFGLCNALVLMSYASLFTMVAFLVRNLGATIGICVSFTVIENLITKIFESASALKDVKFLAEALPYTAFNRLSDIGYGNLPKDDYWKVILACALIIAVTSAISLFTFYKRDIK